MSKNIIRHLPDKDERDAFVKSIKPFGWKFEYSTSEKDLRWDCYIHPEFSHSVIVIYPS